MSTRAVLLVVLLGLLGLGVLVGIAAVVLPWNTLPEELLFSIIVAGMYALGLLVVFSVGARMSRTRGLVLAAAALSFVGYMAAIWFDGMMGWTVVEWVHRVSTVVLVAGFALTQRLMLVPLRPRAVTGRVACRAGLITGAITAVLLCVGMLFENLVFDNELFIRLLGVAAIVAAGGTIGAGLVWFFERKPEHADPGLLGEGVPVRLTCPRCAAAIEARSNRDARCDGCRLVVRVEVEEPRCACGYLLYQLTAEICPECGKMIPEGDRWRVPGSPGASVPLDE